MGVYHFLNAMVIITSDPIQYYLYVYRPPSQIRLQKEANRRIADLAEKAHAEAVGNLDERTREVYHENVRMSQALALHMEHEETLQKAKEQLEMSNRSLACSLACVSASFQSPSS